MDKGGCTIWYNEKALMTDIEKRLGQTVTILDALSSDAPTQSHQFHQGEYGAKRGEGKGSGYEAHTAEMRPAVVQLSELERKAQLSYLNLRKVF